MDDSLHLPAAHPREWIGYVSLGAVFLAVVLVPALSSPGLLWAGVAYFPMAGAAFWQAWRCRRLERRGVLIDGEGIGPAEDGIRLWTLPWSGYGGYRRSPATARERMRRPERGGYEVLGRDGQPLFNVLLPGGGKAATATRALLDEMNRRVPPDGFPYDPSAAVNPRREVVWAGLGVGAVLAVLAAWGLGQPALSRAWSVGVFATVFAPAGFLAAGMEALSIRRKGRRKELPAPPPLPEEGPAMERHLALRGRSPIALEEGRRYRTVDPTRRRQELRTVAKGVWALPMGYAIAIGYLALAASDPRVAPMWIFSALLFGGMSTLAIPSLLVGRAQVDAVDDVLWVHDGALVVVRPGKPSLVLPLPSGSDAQARRRLGFLGATDVLRSAGGERYYLDRTRLYLAPSEIGGLD